MIEPCSGPTLLLQVVIALLAALNVALATWLAHRRKKADVRDDDRYNGHLERIQKP